MKNKYIVWYNTIKMESNPKLTETERMKEYQRKNVSAHNKLKKDIKILEKYKMTCEKKLSKLGGKKAVVDNEEINEGSIDINGKTVRTYTQNGDKSYNVTYDDGSKDVIAVSNDAWDEINTLHMNATNSR